MSVDTSRAWTRWHWAIERWWHGPGARHAAVVAGVAAALLTAWAWQGAVQERSARTALESRLAAPPGAAPPMLTARVTEPVADFTTTLPASISPAQALEVVQSAAARAKVVIDAIQVQEAAPTVQRLGRAEVSITARGSYADLKRWLAEATDRLPAATVSRLQMLRADSAAEVEARLVLVVWARPVAAEGAAAEGR
jgi:Type II secretion system (T2SS), protein M subtype b